MKLSIMQPYIFPYLGYYQMVAATDKFVVYDDVNFIKQGWINRNRILLNGTDFLFTVPLQDASSFKTIEETRLHEKNYSAWVKKFSATLTQAYKRSAFYNDAFPLILSVLETGSSSISDLTFASIKQVCDYLDISTGFVNSSKIYQNAELKAQERILDICKLEKASVYINPIGGRELYSVKDFKSNQIELFFINSDLRPYPQNTKEFIKGLSIIDVLMNNSKNDVKQMLHHYTLI